MGFDPFRDRTTREIFSVFDDVVFASIDIGEVLWEAVRPAVHRYGKDFFMQAARCGQYEVVKRLLADGVDLTGHSSLCTDILRGLSAPECYIGVMPYILQLVIGRGADIHYRAELAFRIALDNQNPEVVKTLLKAGTNVHARSDFLITAVKGGNSGIIQMLLAAGVDIHSHNEGALRAAVKMGRTDLVQLLVLCGAKAPVGYDLLNDALMSGIRDIVEILVGVGCRWTIACLVTLTRRWLL
ncbi:hypothetical protein HDV00_000152 [Rhizophlyctis rosea]|nr:hypothetical protein HDV00_000152 [Rhizophlyctis rosea]